MMSYVYLLIALLATILGTITGLGGGVVIKPILDALGDYDVFVISVLSSATVFSMSMVSTVRRIARGVKIDTVLVLLAAGGIAGGFIGKQLFELSIAHIEPQRLTGIQAVLIIALLQIAIFKNKLPDWRITGSFPVLSVGIILGALSAYIGIGGGPINVAVLCMFFAMDIKEAAAGSLFIILFSQLAKLVSIALTTGFGPYDYSILWYMVPAGVAGSLIGAMVKRRLSHKAVEIIFTAMVVGIALLNVFIIIRLSV